MSKPTAVLLPCGHFSQGTNPDGTPRCTICGDREAIQRMKAPASRPGPTSPATAAPVAAVAALGTDSPTPGVYLDIPDEVYHADPLRAFGAESLSVSWSKKLLSPGSPARYRWDKDHARVENKEFDLGHAAHGLVLGVGATLVEVDADSWRTKAAQDARDAAYAIGAVPLLPKQMRQVEDMATEIAEHPRFDELLSGGDPEVSAFAIDSTTGVWLRSRFDYLKPDGITDYKTTVCAHPDKFVKSAVEYGYHSQDAMYRDIAAELGLGDLPVTFMAQEKEPPYLVAVIDLPDDMIAAGRRRNRQAIDLFAWCLSHNEWPGYPRETVTLTTPAWMRSAAGLDPALEAQFAELLKEGIEA